MPARTVEITCELAFSDGHELTHQEADVIRKALVKSVKAALPHKVRASWVQQGLRFLGIPAKLSRARVDLMARVENIAARDCRTCGCSLVDTQELEELRQDAAEIEAQKCQ